MTTKAGLVGLLGGLSATFILFIPVFLASFNIFSPFWPSILATVTLFSWSGWLAAKWSGSLESVRCAALGALAGGVAGIIIFCLFGAAASGLIAGDYPQSITGMGYSVARIVSATQTGALSSLLAGGFLGLAGGWLACPQNSKQKDVFDKAAPQMALNAAITAVPASVVGTGLAAFVFSSLAQQIALPAHLSLSLDLPGATGLLLMLIAHLALTLVIPHEAREAEHRSGMDEVKMAAFVSIGCAPALFAMLFWADRGLFSNPFVIAAMLATAGMSLKSLHTLFTQILPGRTRFPAPEKGWQTIEATFFGTIAKSQGPRLILLCIGCGLVMILPLHVTTLAALINLNVLLLNPPPEQNFIQHLFLSQALTSLGLMAASAGILIIIYLFYLNLGRWFCRSGSRNNPDLSEFP